MIIYVNHSGDIEDIRLAFCKVLGEGHLPVSPETLCIGGTHAGIKDAIDDLCMAEADEMWIYGEELTAEVQLRIAKYSRLSKATTILYKS